MDLLRIAKGQDVTREITVIAYWDDDEPIAVKLSSAAVAGATSLSVDRNKYALVSGDMLIFDGNLVVTVDTAGAAIGASSVPVTAIAGAIKGGEVGKKLQDLTGYTISLEVLDAASDATPEITKSGTNQTQNATDGRGRVRFTIAAADTTGLEAKRYSAAAWKTDSGSKRPLWTGDVEVYDDGFE